MTTSSKQPLYFILSLLTLLWTLLTLIAGLCSSGRLGSIVVSTCPSLVHPYWVAATLVPLLGLYSYWICRLGKSKPSAKQRDEILKKYTALFGLAAALFTGLGAHMGFLPMFFHQLTVWPLVMFMGWEGIKGLRKF